MKVAVAFLVMLGLLAAVCATVLVKSLTARPGPAQEAVTSDPDVDILVATRDITPTEIVDTNAVTTKKIPAAQVPEGALLNSVQVVGKVLTTRMVQGQPFTKTNFIRTNDGMFLAASLPRGKRAISVSLAEWSGMAGLLYPGGVVDVLVSIKPGSGAGNDTVCTTVLQGLQVLAIGQQSIASEEFKDKEPGALAGSGKMNYRMVTLLVDPKQAELIQLAIQNGSVSLSMRNPMDAGRESPRMTRTEELMRGLAPVRSGLADFAALVARYAATAAANRPA